VVVLDGFALLQLSATVVARARRDLTIIVFVHYPLSLEPDATPRTRQLCLEQEQVVIERCDGVIAAGDASRDAIRATYRGLDPALISVLRPPYRFEAQPANNRHVHFEQEKAAAARPARSPARGRARSPARTGSPETGRPSPRGASPRDASPPVRAALAWQPTATVKLLLVANATPRKNIGSVLRALGALKRAGGRGASAWQLRVAGSMDAHPTEAAAVRAEAEALGIGEHVEWSGELGGAALAQLYRTADLFVFTSLYENFCMAAHEATFFGLPLLAYDVGEIASFGAHAGCTLLPVLRHPALPPSAHHARQQP